MEQAGYTRLKAIKGLTKEALEKMKVKDGHVIVILDGIKDLEEWPIKVRVPAAVGDMGGDMDCALPSIITGISRPCCCDLNTLILGTLMVRTPMFRLAVTRDRSASPE